MPEPKFEPVPQAQPVTETAPEVETPEERERREKIEELKKEVQENISNGKSEIAREIIKSTKRDGIDPEVFTESFSQGIQKNILRSWWLYAQNGISLAKENGIEPEIRIEHFFQGVQSRVSNGDWEGAEEGVNLSRESGFDVKVFVEIFFQGIQENISEGNRDVAREGVSLVKKCGIDLEILEPIFEHSVDDASLDRNFSRLANTIVLCKEFSLFPHILQQHKDRIQNAKNQIVHRDAPPTLEQQKALELLTELFTCRDPYLAGDLQVMKLATERYITGNTELGWNRPNEEVAQNYEALVELLGVDRVHNIFAINTEFWKNPHDSLLFVGHIRSQSEEDQRKITELVLRPLDLGSSNFLELNNLFGSFDVNLYIARCEGETVPFRSWKKFEREVQMQKYNIEIPAEASDAFRDAIGRLIEAPGVNVPFIRQMIDEYVSSNTGREAISERRGKADFAQQLIRYIEQPETIDREQVISHYSEEISFDPLHRVFLSAVGIHGLNQQTPKLYEALQKNESLQSIVALLREHDTRLSKELETKRDQLKKHDPAKAGRYDAEFRKEVDKAMALRFGAGSTLAGIRLDNHERYAFSLSELDSETIQTQLLEALGDASLRSSVNGVLQMLATNQEPRRSLVESFVDMNLPSVRDSLERIRQAQDIASLSGEEILKLFGDDTLVLTEILLFLGLNNRERQQKARRLLASIDPFFKKPKYKSQVPDPRMAYLQGKLALDEDDETFVRDAMNTFFGEEHGRRMLGVEIAKKSDPRGWVCGDYTDCCMPFTSGKNKEYLTRPDMAYFLVSQKSEDGSEDIIAQSVLVYCEDEETITIALDNIEVANRAIRYNPIIAEGYKRLKERLKEEYGSKGKRLKIVIGRSYNDDQGLITGECELTPVDATPLRGDIGYSDWLYHSANYVWHDSNAEERHQRYFGLSEDMWERSRVRAFLREHPSMSPTEQSEIENHLRSIGRGEDDGGGGLIFPDNYSCSVERGGRNVGYIIGADYVSGDDANDLVHIEAMRLDDSIPIEEQQAIFDDYLSDRGFENDDNIDGLYISASVIGNNPFIHQVLEGRFGNAIEGQKDGSLVVKFERE